MTKPRTGLRYLYSELWSLARGHRGKAALGFSFLLASQLLNLLVPFFSGRAINTLQRQGLPGMGTAGLWLSGVFIAALAGWALHGPGRILERNVALAVRRKLSTELVDKVFSLPLAWHESHHSAETSHRISQSAGALYDFAQSQFIYLQNFVGLVGPLVALALVSIWVGTGAVLAYIGVFIAIVWFDRRMIVLAHDENNAERRYSAALQDSVGNVLTVHALRQRRGIVAFIERRLLAIYEPLRRAIVLNEWKWFTVDLAGKAISCLLVALYAWLAATGRIGAVGGIPQTNTGATSLPLGDLFMVYQYALGAAGVVSGIASHFQTFSRQLANYASAEPVRLGESSPLAGDAVASRKGVETGVAPTSTTRWKHVQIEGLTFTHASRSGAGPTLVDLKVELEAGRRYALIGGSGAGKSTLLRMLAGLYVADRVSLVLDEGPVITDPVAAAMAFRQSSTLIPQDAEVFEGTLAENLALCETLSGPVAADDMRAAIKVAHANGFVEANPLGLDAPVAERGANWSGGQRQRVALARGVLAALGGSLVLLDEPTASLDPQTESIVYANLFEAFGDACVISSIHRLHLLDRFDEVILMEKGRVIDQGPASELRVRSAAFRDLLSHQA
ncbi:ABC transporter ATP-binding protein [soil metagenome]